MSETEKSANLENARAGSHIRSARRMVKNAKPSFKLLFYLQALDLFFLVAFAVAFVKDLLDWIGIGSLPAIGTVVTLVASFCIWAAMTIAGASSMIKNRKGVIKKYAVLAGGTIAEMLFGLNFIPIETIIVVVIFYLSLVERRAAAEENSQPEKAVYA